MLTEHLDRLQMHACLALWLAATGCSAGQSSVERPQGGAPATREADPIAQEMRAYEQARPVFEKYCAGCHTERARGTEHAEALLHFSMVSYPFGGHHADEIAAEIRAVLGAAGNEPTMPPDTPGVVRGEELDLVLAWADAFDRAQAVRSADQGHDQHQPDEHAHHGTINRTFQVPPGKFVELNLRLDAGATVSVDYKAGAALSWNVHSHEAGRTIVHREGRDSGGSVSFTAESAGVYSYLWKNDATTETTLDVTTTLGTGVAIHSWHP
jgi:mono/diheme cytochrome c family protein